MAAPIKVLNGSIIRIFKKNASNCRNIYVLGVTNGKNCIFSSQVAYCHVNLQDRSHNLAKNVWKFRSQNAKGGNCLFTKASRTASCIHIPESADILKPVIKTSYTNRHYSTLSDSNVGNGKHLDAISKRGNSHCTAKPTEVKENVWTVPNMLTMSRIVLTPVIGYLVVTESFSLALGLFAFAGLTDLLDGYIARNFKNQMSAFGTALDPLADKILVTVLTLTLTTAQLLPLPLAVVIVGRDALLVAAGFVIRYISLPPPRTLKRYFDVTNPSAKILPSNLSKLNTTLQLSLVCLTLAAPVFGFIDHAALQGLWWLTGATTVGSGIDYVINRKRSVQFLHTNNSSENK